MPTTISDMVDTINETLPKAYQLTQQHTEQLENAFGDVRLLQDLWQMKGDALNSQLRTPGGLDPLQICAVRQVLCHMQQQCLAGS